MSLYIQGAPSRWREKLGLSDFLEEWPFELGYASRYTDEIGDKKKLNVKKMWQQMWMK